MGRGSQSSTEPLIPPFLLQHRPPPTLQYTTTSGEFATMDDQEKVNVGQPINEKNIEGGTGQVLAPVHLEHVDHITSETEWKHMLDDAIAGEANEKSLHWREALRLYPKATFWSFAISLCIVM